MSFQNLEVRTLLSAYNYFDFNNSTMPQGDLYEGDELNMNLHVVAQDYNPDFFPQVYIGFGEYDPQVGNVGYNVDITGTEQDVSVDHVYQNNATFGAALYLWDTEDSFNLNIFNRQPEGTANYSIDDDNGGQMVYTIDGSDISPVDVDAGLRYSFGYTYAELSGTYWSASASSSFTYDPELDNDGVFYGRVFDCDGAFCDIPINAPMVPTLNWDAVHHDSVRFSWDNSITNGQEEHWIVQRAADVDGHPGTWQTVATLDAGEDHWTDPNVSPGTRYWYRVRAQGTPGTVGDTGWSAKRGKTTLVQTPAPSGQTASRAPGTNDITINWSGETGDTFNVYRNGVGGTLIYSGPAHTYSDTSTKTPQSAYTYQIIATKDGQDDSDYVQATAYTMPTTPTGLQAFVVSGTEVQLYWDDTNNNVRYRVYRGATSGFIPDDNTNLRGFTDQDHYADTTSANTTYYYKLVAEWVGLANSLPTDAVQADTHATYQPNVVSFDDALVADDNSYQNASGEFYIPFYSAYGAATSIAIAPPDDLENPFVLGTDYDLTFDSANHEIEISITRAAPYVVQVHRTRGNSTHTEAIGIMDDSGWLDENADGVMVPVQLMLPPFGGLNLVSSASGGLDPYGSIQRIRNALIDDIAIDNVYDVEAQIVVHFEEIGNTKFRVNIYDHGEPAYVGMGAGWGAAPYAISYIDPYALDNLNVFMTAAAGRVDRIYFYECDVAKTEAGRAFLQTIADGTGATVYAFTKKIAITNGPLNFSAWWIERGGIMVSVPPQS